MISRRDFCRAAGLTGLMALALSEDAFAWLDMSGDAPLTHTFHLNPKHAFRHHKEGIASFTERVKEQYDQSGKVNFILEFLTAEGEQTKGWMIGVQGPNVGLIGKCQKDPGKYVTVHVHQNEGSGYRSAGEYRIGVIVKNGKKHFVAYNVEKDECHEEEADEKGLGKIVKWIFILAAAYVGVKIAIWLLSIMVMLAVAVLFIVLVKVLFDHL